MNRNLIEQAIVIANELEDKATESPATVPEKGGVYLVYRGVPPTASVIYVGEAKVLKRRITSDHISGEQKATTSEFRKKLNQRFSIPFGPGMRSWVEQNCSFSYVVVEDYDMRVLVEAMLIAALRAGGAPLLNSKR